MGNGKVFRTDDGGVSWAELSSGLTGWALLVTVDPGGERIFGAEIR